MAIFRKHISHEGHTYSKYNVFDKSWNKNRRIKYVYVSTDDIGNRYRLFNVKFASKHLFQSNFIVGPAIGQDVVSMDKHSILA